MPQSLIGAVKTGQIGGSKGAQQIEMVVFSFSCWERLRVGFLFSSQVLRWSVSILPTEFFIFLMRFSGFLTDFHMGVENYKFQFQLQMQIQIRFQVPFRVQGTDFFVSSRVVTHGGFEGVVSTKLPEEYGVVMNSSLEL